MNEVMIFSDGSSKGNPGPGGYGTILKCLDAKGELHELKLTEGFAVTTNNRMELMGAIKGFEALTKPCKVLLISDSKYLIDAFVQNWIGSWQKNNWKNSKKEAVKNKDLWLRLLDAMKSHDVRFEWVKGHAGHPENEECDRLATTSADGENLKDDTGYFTDGV